MTTLIKNGTIITATDMYKADILVKNGLISEIARKFQRSQARSSMPPTSGSCRERSMCTPIWIPKSTA